MKHKRLVFITGDDYGQIGIIEWRVNGNLNMLTFDPVATYHEAMKALKRPWDDLQDAPEENLIYVFYPDGNPGFIEFTTEIEDVLGEPFKLSKVTARQTAAGGMMPVHLGEEAIGEKK